MQFGTRFALFGRRALLREHHEDPLLWRGAAKGNQSQTRHGNNHLWERCHAHGRNLSGKLRIVAASLRDGEGMFIVLKLIILNKCDPVPGRSRGVRDIRLE